MNLGTQNYSEKSRYDTSANSGYQRDESDKDEGFMFWFFDSMFAFLGFGCLIYTIYFLFGIFLPLKFTLEIYHFDLVVESKMEFVVAFSILAILSFVFFKIRRLLKNHMRK